LPPNQTYRRYDVYITAMEMKKSVIFDGRFLAQNSPSGIRRDSEALFKAFQKNEWSVNLLKYKGMDDNARVFRLATNISANETLISATTKSILYKSNLVIPEINSKCFFLSQISPIGVTNGSGPLPRIIRIHDLFPLTNPEWFTIRARINFLAGLKSIGPTDTLMTNSKYTSHKLLEILGKKIKVDQIVMVSCEVPNFEKSAACKSCEMCVPSADLKNYILAVGTIEPRKNYVRMIQGWDASLLHRNDIKFVIVGKPGWKVKSLLSKIKRTNGVIHLSNVCDYQLNILYANCLAFISASLDEGFNIPIQEAQKKAPSLILSDIPVHKEFVKMSKVSWIDPNSVDSIVSAMNLVRELNTSQIVRPFPNSFDNDFKKFVSLYTGQFEKI
jgi:glycosyltransferase involved in cell wall biosynthesis